MPIWDVICKKCGKTQDDVIVFHSQEIPSCECGGEREKLLGCPAFTIKGWSAANGYCDEGLANMDTIPDKYVEPRSKKKKKENDNNG